MFGLMTWTNSDEQYQRPANQHGLVGIYHDRYCSRINCRGIVMKVYEAEIQYKKREPWYAFSFEAANDTEANLLAKRYEKGRIGIKRFNEVFKSMTVRPTA